MVGFLKPNINKITPHQSHTGHTCTKRGCVMVNGLIRITEWRSGTVWENMRSLPYVSQYSVSECKPTSSVNVYKGIYVLRRQLFQNWRGLFCRDAMENLVPVRSEFNNQNDIISKCLTMCPIIVLKAWGWS